MDALTRMYAEAWSQLPVEVLALVVLPAPRPGGDADGDGPAATAG